MRKFFVVFLALFFIGYSCSIRQNNTNILENLDFDFENVNQFLEGKFKYLDSHEENKNLEKNKNDLDSSIVKVFKRILNNQSKKDVSFRFMPPRFEEYKGLFKSSIHINFLGKTEKEDNIKTWMRRNFFCPDTNMFVTNFVVVILLEVSKMKEIDLKDEVIINALNVMLEFKDNNHPNSPIYSFWRQIKNGKYWSANPESMVTIMKNLPDMDKLIKIAKLFGLKKVVDFFETFKQLWIGFQYAYRIPGDLDDTYTAVAVSAMLKDLNNTSFNNVWFSNTTNDNLFELFESIKQFTYKPFNNTEEYSLDPRTYIWIHDFVHTMKNRTDIQTIIPTTWMWKWSWSLESNGFVNMPFNTNNVDLNVVGNFLFGIINTLIYNKDHELLNKIAENKENVDLILTTIELFIWSVENDIVGKRYDVTILYYPSIWDYYWLISRSSYLITSYLDVNNYDQSYVHLRGLVEKIILGNSRIRDQLKTNMMNYLNKKVVVDENQAYVFEFLGNYNGKTRNEDSLFSTGLVINSLINTWTNKRNNKVSWDEDVSDSTKVLLKKLTNYVISKVNEKKPNRLGAFFSGSVHNSYSSYPTFYPANFKKTLNGTDIPYEDFDKIPFDYTYAVNGYMSEEEFNDQKYNKTHFGRKTPLVPDDLNGSEFPFWSSQAMTDSIVLLALSKVKELKLDLY